MAAELQEYVKQKTVAFMLIILALLIAGIAFNALILLSSITILVGLTALIINQLLEKGIIKPQHVSSVILIGAGIVLFIVGLILKGVIPIMTLTHNIMADAIFTTTIYIILGFIVVFTAVTLYDYMTGRRLLSRLTKKASIEDIESKYLE